MRSQETRWYLLLYALCRSDDVFLVDESRTRVEHKLKLWKRTLEAKGFRLSKFKTEYMKCDFSATMQEKGMLDLMFRWYPRNTPFATWDRYS
jgi:hypothetical protein